jgi:Flp pilus assembly protein TadG
MCSKRTYQHGGVLVESAIILPVLALICLGCFEIGRYITTYMALSHAIREAGIISSRIKDISGSQSNLTPTEATYTACFNTWTTSTTNCGHTILHWVARNVAFSQKHFMRSGTLSITTTANADNTITIQMSAQHEPSIPYLGGWTFNINTQQKISRF